MLIRHPEVAAQPPSKDERPPAGPSPFEARFRSHLRVTGIDIFDSYDAARTRCGTKRSLFSASCTPEAPAS
jgi:hypothetical protein